MGKMKPKIFIFSTFVLIAMIIAGCVLDSQDTAPRDLQGPTSKVLDVPLLKQGDFECGPASLAMYTCYLRNVIGIGECKTSSGVRDDLVRLNPQYFWVSYDGNNIPRPVYPAGDELPVAVLPPGSPVPFTLTDGYVIKGVDTLSGTYPGYLEELALTYYSTASFCVSTFQGGNTELLESYINDDIPVIVDLWAHGRMEPGYVEGASYTHFVVVTGYDERNIEINDPYSFSRIKVDRTVFENAWCADEQSGALQSHAPDYRRGWGMVIFQSGSPPGATPPACNTPASTSDPDTTPSPPVTESITVDDGDGGFILYGPTEYWHRVTSGSHYYGGDMYWTYVNGNLVCNGARWRPVLPEAGNYAVQAYIDWDNATTASALYRIVFSSGTDTVTINQNDYADTWVDIGTYPFDPGSEGYVELTDATGEDPNSLLKIGVDAVRWIKI